MSEKINYIFSITTGRSGSEYLQKIFEHVIGCVSYHESYPIGNASEMRLFAQGKVMPMEKLAKMKAERISESKRKCNLYFESNHCFIKGFGWFMPRYLDERKMGVIILKRDKSKIANSLLRIGCSPLNSYGRKWISIPNMKSPLVQPPTTPINYHLARYAKLILLKANRLKTVIVKKESQLPQWIVNYELKCLNWYIEETYAKAEAFKKNFHKIRYYEVNIDCLNSLKSAQQMISYFGFKEMESLSGVVGRPVNLKPS